MPRFSFKEESRKDWGINLGENEPISTANLQFGAILRIADSLEKMEVPFTALIRDNEYYKSRNKALREQIDKQAKQIAAYKGIIRRMKKEKAQ